MQIHHVDDDPSASSMGNLAGLCLDCHTATQIIGGFHRKLDSEQLSCTATIGSPMSDVNEPRRGSSWRTSCLDPIPRLSSPPGIADIYREANAYEVLAMHYAVWGNEELRDKYIDLAINAGMDDESIIYYRSCQGRTDLISPQVITRQGRYAFHRTLQTGGTRGSQSYGRVHAEQKRRADA